jgi:Phage envelope protein
MSKAIELLQAAQKHGMSIRPKVGGFPFLAEALRKGGVTHNMWTLPSCQSIYLTTEGTVVQQSTPLVTDVADVPAFNEEKLIKALRADQAGQTTFPEFLKATWEAGCVRYDVDFEARMVIYYGIEGEFYEEEYPEVEI